MVTEKEEQLEGGIQTTAPIGDVTTKWYRRPYLWALLILFAGAVVAAIAIPVALSTRAENALQATGNSPTMSPSESPSESPTWIWSPTSSESPSAPTAALTPEQIACDFLQVTNLRECRATAQIPFCGMENLNSPYVGCTFLKHVGWNWGARTIPSEIGLLTQLTQLALNNFQMTGTIPSTLSNLTKLTSLDMSSNKLKGTIPSSLSSLTQLQTLYIYHNLLTGSVPSYLSMLTQLSYLDLHSNSLTGEIPSSFSNLTKLQTVNFARNLLNGTILPSLCSITNNFLIIDCDEIACDCCHDDFDGACPTGSPTSSESPSAPTPALTPEQIACDFLYVNLTECRATATIPFCGFEYLNSQYTSCESFDNYIPNGARTIPSEIGVLTHLTELNLYYFQLTGTIPSTLSNLTLLTSLRVQGNKLSGTIPSSLSRLTQLQKLVFSDNRLLVRFHPPCPDSLS